MTGETDLTQLLDGLSATRRPGEFTVVTVPQSAGEFSSGVEAVVREPAGVTLVVRLDVARQRGWEVGPTLAWLTLDVHSSLTAVGLTAAVAKALAEVNIACNVLAGYYHDHLLVPISEVSDARDAIAALGRRSAR